MSEDRKWNMQMLAEELADKLYGKEFYDLPQNLQMEVYHGATVEYVERLCDRADCLRKATREQR